MRRFVRALVLIGVTLGMASAALVEAQTVNPCVGKKLTCVTALAVAHDRCYAKAAKAGAALDPACTQKARDKFSGPKGCIAKSERKPGCLTTGDADALATTVEGFVDDLVAALDPGFPTGLKNKCTGGKHGCVATKVKALLQCHVKAAKKGVLDPTCTAKAMAKFDGGSKPAKACFTKLEQKPGCVTTGDRDALEIVADDFVHSVVCALDAAAPECTLATPTPTMTPQSSAGTPGSGATPSPSPSPSPETLPPDFTTIAPPVEPGVAAALPDATEFLYTGANPIQTGVAPATIDPTRVAVLRGLVLTRNGQPLPGVVVTILNHPELGQTLTRANGVFDLAVNGGGELVVSYTLTGFLPAQRQIYAPWNDYAILPNVVLIALDAQVTAVDLTAAVPMQVARGSTASDADGSRRATVMFPQGTTATMVFPNGSTQPLTALGVRATEYTVGATGPAAMPAELPATSGYTYCAELSIDEALAAGAADVQFSAPLPFYVENFLGFPIGMDVPLGSYDRRRGVWIPEANGRVIKILSVTGNKADVDSDGDGLADAALAMSDAERQQLATLYAPGQTLQRMLITHFTPYDANMPVVPPPDAIFPQDDPEPDDPLDDPCTQSGNSVIECQNQILGETISVVGTDFGLQYQSDRTRGYLAANTLEIPLSGGSLPASILGIELEIEVAGRHFARFFPPFPNQKTTFTWDGKDAYGRALDGPQPITVNIHYVYPAVYAETTRFGDVPASSAVTVVPSRERVKLTRIAPLFIGTFHANSAGLGGWALSPHHAYVPTTKTLFRGDGRRESASAEDTLGPIMTSLTASTGSCFSIVEGGPASQAKVCPEGVAVGPDGSVYVAEVNQRVHRIGADGKITTVAGTGSACASPTGVCGDGGSATAAELNRPWALAAGPDGSLYIAEISSDRIRKVDPSGTITTVVGTGVECPSASSPCGDGGPGTQAQLRDALGLAVGPDNALYIADTFDNRIRRLGPDGIITTVAGTGSGCNVLPSTQPPFCGEGGAATEAPLSQPQSVAVGRDGSLYIVSNGSVVRRVTPDGIIRTLAGSFKQGGSPADGIPAIQAGFGQLSAVAVDIHDTVYVAVENHLIRSFRPGGEINTVAGIRNVATTGGDGGPARRATLTALGNNSGLGIGPDGSVYVTQRGNTFPADARVRRIAPIGDEFLNGERVIPAVDGTEAYIFTPAGQHLRTVDALTGAVQYQFTYDSGGRLATIKDRSDNITTVERDAQGTPTGILGPFGQRTLLDVDANGYLSEVTNPADEPMLLDHTASGLLTSVTHAGGQTSSYGYDNLGRLTSATDPTNATKTLSRSGSNKDRTITVTTALGRATSYRATTLSNGDIELTSTDASGAEASALIGRDGHSTLTDPNGTTLSVELSADPRWGMRAPILSSMIVKTPSGLTRTFTRQRSVSLASPGALLNVSALTDAATVNGRAATVAYDGATRTLTTTYPTGRQTKAVFDSQARLVQAQTGNLEPTDVGYDAQGRLATIATGPVGNRRTTTLAYASNGFLETVTDPLDRIISLTKDAAGRSTQVALASGAAFDLGYDPNGFVDSVTPPGKPSHGFGYSARNELTSYTAPAVGNENRQTTIAYNDDRQATQLDRPDGVTDTFTYDTSGRLSVLDLATADRTFTYDAASRVSAVNTNETVGLAHTYDGGLAASLTWSGPVAGSVTRTRDADFRVASLSVNGANVITIQYDADGAPTQVGSLVLTRQPQTGLATGSTLGQLSDTFGYDGFGVLATYAATHNGSGVYSASYTRDKNDRLTSRSETIGGSTHTFGYTYDDDGRLTEVREDGVLVATYTYDPNGNRLSFDDGGGTVSATYDAQDRLVTRGTATYAYSESGDLLRKTVGVQVTTYEYDGSSSLTGATLPNGTQVDYLRDGRGRRVGKKVNGTLVQGLLYQDFYRPIAELDGAGAVVSRFVYAGNGSVPAYMTKGGVTYRIVTDHLGSPRLIVDVASGLVAQRLDYGEFGNVVLDTNPGFQPFGFTGGLYDALTGLVHLGAREYDADTARWTTKDPGGFSGGPNLFAYALNDPINLVDPSGNAPYRTVVPYQPAPPPGSYIPAAPAPAPVPAPPPPPPPAPAPPVVRPPVSGPLDLSPFRPYTPPVAPPPTGTFIPEPPVPPRCPLVARIGLPVAAFVAGLQAGTYINQATGASDIASDTGQNVKRALINEGVPEWLSEVGGFSATFAGANGGPLGIVLSEIFD